MRRWAAWVAILVCCLAGQAIGFAENDAAPVVLTAEQLAAFEGEAWAGFVPVLWQETYGQEDDPDDPRQGEQGAIAVMHKEGQNALCILGQTESGAWRLLDSAPFALRTGPYAGDNAPRIHAYSLEEIDIYYELQRGQEGCTIRRTPEGYAFTHFYHTDAQGMYHTLHVDNGWMELRWMGEGLPNETILQPAGAINRTLFAFHREELIEYLSFMYGQRNDARYMPDSGHPDTFPQGLVYEFAKGKAYDVYTGPGTQYARAGDEGRGNAKVSTNDWIQVFGREGDWLLIQYNLNDWRNRIGYIAASALPAGADVLPLAFDGREAVSLGLTWVTDDPLRNVSEFETLHEGEDVTWLATLGDHWVYIEAGTQGGARYRGFVQAETVALRESFVGTAVVIAQEGEVDAPIYAEASDTAAPVGRYRQGVQAQVLERGEAWTRVRVGDAQAGFEGMMRTADLAFDIAPVDVPSAIETAEVYCVDMLNAPAIQAAPDASSETLGDAYRGSFFRVAGTVQGWTHVMDPNADIHGFVPGGILIPHPEGAAYDGSTAYAGPGGAALRLLPSEEAAILTHFYEGMSFEVTYLVGEWAYVMSRSPIAFAAFKGYVHRDQLVSYAADALPLATVSIQQPTPYGLGPCEFLREMPHENGGDRDAVATGARALVMGESGDWRYVRVGEAHGYLHADNLVIAQGMGNYETSLYLGDATALAPAGEDVVAIYQFPDASAATIGNMEAGTPLRLVADLDGWWQVQSPDWYGTGFIPDASIRLP